MDNKTETTRKYKYYKSSEKRRGENTETTELSYENRVCAGRLPETSTYTTIQTTFDSISTNLDNHTTLLSSTLLQNV
eukprot:6474953-Amphidinium_carterae.2